MDLSPKAKETKAKIKKWETNLEAFYTAKETIDQKQQKGQHMEWRKYFQMIGLIRS